jgi:hypothetical protein
MGFSEKAKYKESLQDINAFAPVKYRLDFGHHCDTVSAQIGLKHNPVIVPLSR